MTAAVNLAAMGNGPAFSASGNGQTLTSSTTTKLQLTVEQFDTNNCFDSSTNYRFTPTVAGYYQCNISLTAASAFTGGNVFLYKNGANDYGGMAIGTTTSGGTFVGSTLVYLNGTTDYIEMYGMFGTGQATVGSATKFSASMVRSAV
jgi:hypothetical protein